MTDDAPPSIIFIIPFRNRDSHRHFFTNWMTNYVLDSTNYQMVFVNQDDERPFNRGAMKNIGFLAVKEKYPETYHQITLVFNDVDIVPHTNLFDYNTVFGTVKHFYGFDYALGGIVAIKAGDFEKVNGFPNLWGWGKEDRALQLRCEQGGLQIDRSNFYPIGSPEILHLYDGVEKLIQKEQVNSEPSRVDGIKSIRDLMRDVVTNTDIGSIIDVRVSAFEVINPVFGQYCKYDIRAPLSQLTKTPTVDLDVDPTNIPVHPVTGVNVNVPPPMPSHTVPQKRQEVAPPHLYSSNYAKYAGVKPRATGSVRMSLGGVR